MRCDGRDRPPDLPRGPVARRLVAECRADIAVRDRTVMGVQIRLMEHRASHRHRAEQHDRLANDAVTGERAWCKARLLHVGGPHFGEKEA